MQYFTLICISIILGSITITVGVVRGALQRLNSLITLATTGPD